MSEKIVSAYGLLIEKAIAICNVHVRHPEFARLEIDGDKARLIWFEETSDYDVPSIDVEHKEFAARLLDMSMDEIAKENERLRLEYEEKRKKMLAQQKEEQDQQQRTKEIVTLRYLMAKYPELV